MLLKKSKNLSILNLGLTVGLATSIILGVSGCSSKSENGDGKAPQKVEAASGETAVKLESEGKSVEAAAEYARIGELLLLPEGIQYADKMFDKALELDVKNGKANFYSSVTKPLLKMQGFITRFMQIAEPEEVKKLVSLRKEIESLNLPELTKFALQLPAGKAPFATYHEVQRFMREDLLPEVVKSVEKLDRIVNRTDLELNINLSRLGFPKYHSTSDYSCSQYVSKYNTYEYDGRGVRTPKIVETQSWYCYYTSTQKIEDILKSERIMLDASDLKISRGSMMALADSLRLSSAYSFEGLKEALDNLERLEEKRQASDRELSTKDIIQELSRHVELFTIERDQELQALARSQEQVLRDALDLGELQSELCDNQDRHTGETLVKSFCLYSQDITNINLALDLLAGPTPIKVGFDSNGDEVKVVFNVMALINNPTSDVKALFPNRFDRNGNPLHWPDLTFGGLVPNGDLVEVLEHVVTGKPLKRSFKLNLGKPGRIH